MSTQFDKELEDALLELSKRVIDITGDYDVKRQTRQIATERTSVAISESKEAIKKAVEVHIIGDGEVHVSHVCPPDNIECAKFSARGSMRHDQRKHLYGEDK